MIPNRTSQNLGISVVICCHNSKERLLPTLTHLFKQNNASNLPWEIILVDNASTDETQKEAKTIWNDFGCHPLLTIVEESQIGIAHARRAGIKAASFEYICFIDDDNWVSENWNAIVFGIFQSHPDIGVIGGCGKAMFNVKTPQWFNENEIKKGFACSPQGEQAGYIEYPVYGAGICFRKYAIQSLLSDGFQPKLLGRAGKNLFAGDDTELCLAIMLAGWKVWYEPALRFDHFVPSHRLTTVYLKKMWYGFGCSQAVLDPYFFAFNFPGEIIGKNQSWIWKSLVLLKSMFKVKYGIINVLSDSIRINSLTVIRYLGYLRTLLRMRTKYDKLFIEIRSSPWNKKNNLYLND